MLSAVILTKNEEKNILDCLESIYWADEIIIIDDFSDDMTLDVIKSLDTVKKIKIFQRKLENNFSEQRNFAMGKTRHEWILFLDADERITEDLREEINSALIEDKNTKKYNGYYVPRRDVMWGKELRHGESGSIKLLRLAKKGFSHWQGLVHEEWLVEGKTSELENHLLHFPHPSVNDFLKEINFYTTIRAEELFKKNIRSKSIDMIIYPKLKFIKNYFFKRGFLDGVEGLVFAILMSFHSFLVRGKLWILWQRK